MKTARMFKLVIVIFIAMFLSNIAFAQPYLQEKRIYVVDVTGSMEGRGAVETPNIFNKVKLNLVSAIESIPTSSTEVVIIPFTNRPVGEFSGTIEHKDSLTSYISDLKIFGGDTNIADAWDRGISHIDTTKVNYIFLLTDGLHNCGPSSDALYQKLSKWGESTAGKYVFAFYVMLTPNAKDLEICKIIEGSRNIWLIESMNIDASLVKTSILLKKNVFHDGNTSISFDSTNPNIDLNDVGITVDIEDNQFYDISDLRSSEEVGTFSFNIIEKKEKREMPILDTIGLRISHNKEAYPFVFFTPDYIELIVANQGPRHISITDNIRKEKHLKPMNLGTIKFREPFRGIFESARPYMESSLEGPPFSWFMSDTSAITKNLYVTFNEEAIRSKSNISFELRNEQGLLINNVQFQYGNEKCIAACDSTITVPLTYTILPGTESGTINGYLVANTSNIDFINDKETNSGKDSICDFSVTYKETGTWFLWLLLSLIIIVIVAIVLYGLYWIFKGLFIAIKWIVKGIIKIITLPFSALGSLFSSIGSSVGKTKLQSVTSKANLTRSNDKLKRNKFSESKEKHKNNKENEEDPLALLDDYPLLKKQVLGMESKLGPLFSIDNIVVQKLREGIDVFFKGTNSRIRIRKNVFYANGGSTMMNGAMNEFLNNPLPSQTYYVDKHSKFVTDAAGRTIVSECHSSELSKHVSRNELPSQNKTMLVRSKGGIQGVHDSGHIQQHYTGGQNESINLIPMKASLQRGGEWAKLERVEREAIDSGSDVWSKKSISYKQNGSYEINVNLIVDGKITHKKFNNLF